MEANERGQPVPARLSRFSSSAALVLLRVPTPGAIFWGARHVPRPLLLPGFGIGEGVSG